MDRRIYFLLPDIDTTHRVVKRLLEKDVSEEHMHVVGREDAQTRDLPEADISETRDLVGSAERGAVAGGATGLLAGLTALVFPPAGIAVGGGVVAATGLAGVGFGAWVSSMIGIRHESDQVAEYEQAIESGQVLMMVDVAKDRVDEIENVVREAHPDVKLEGTEAHTPIFS